jgi:4-amino-4-deoxy-L-arabinose transferase-like glycosyltransferase
MNRYATAIVLLILLVYWAVSLENLTAFPPVGEDEPWIAAAPYKLAIQGLYGSDLFAGYYGLERHNYQHMPLFPLLQAGLFRLGGVGVFQMRLLPVIFGTLLLAATFAEGKQFGGTLTRLLVILLLVASANGALRNRGPPVGHCAH